MFKKFITWFRKNVYPADSMTHVDLRQSGTHARPLQRALQSRPDQRPARAAAKKPAAKKPAAPAEIDPDTLNYDSDFSAQIEDLGPGKNILKRNKYVREDAGTHDTLKIISEDELEAMEDDTGGDPYNTGQFDPSGSWKNRTRE